MYMFKHLDGEEYPYLNKKNLAIHGDIQLNTNLYRLSILQTRVISLGFGSG